MSIWSPSGSPQSRPLWSFAPVSFHRLVFRRRQKPWLVHAAHQLAKLGLICLAWAIVGALWLVFDFVAGRPVSMIVLGLAVVFYAMLWWGAQRLA